MNFVISGKLSRCFCLLLLPSVFFFLFSISTFLSFSLFLFAIFPLLSFSPTFYFSSCLCFFSSTFFLTFLHKFRKNFHKTFLAKLRNLTSSNWINAKLYPLNEKKLLSSLFFWIKKKYRHANHFFLHFFFKYWPCLINSLELKQHTRKKYISRIGGIWY